MEKPLSRRRLKGFKRAQKGSKPPDHKQPGRKEGARVFTHLSENSKIIQGHSLQSYPPPPPPPPKSRLIAAHSRVLRMRFLYSVTKPDNNPFDKQNRAQAFCSCLHLRQKKRLGAKRGCRLMARRWTSAPEWNTTPLRGFDSRHPLQ